MPNVPQHTMDLLFSALQRVEQKQAFQEATIKRLNTIVFSISADLRKGTELLLRHSQIISAQAEELTQLKSQPAIPAAPVKAKRNFSAKPRRVRHAKR